MATLTPAFVLIYQQRSITRDIATDLVEVSFTDHLSGEADELSITLADPDRKWMGDWYPGKGDRLHFQIGYEGQALLDCGYFEIDEVDIADCPNTVSIRALSAGVTKGVRTVRHRAFDEQTLAQVVGRIAQSLGYHLEGKIEPLPIERLTQQETDLAFLKRLATHYGYAVKVSGQRLIFSQLVAMRAAASLLTLERSQIMPGWHFRDSIRQVYKEAAVSRHHPAKGKTIKASKKEALLDVYGLDSEGRVTVTGRITSEDSHKARASAADPATAQAKADAALSQSNEQQTGGSFSVPGNTQLTAGTNVNLADFGRLSGKYRITQAVHRLSRNDGYITEVEFGRIDDRPPQVSPKHAESKAKPKSTAKTKSAKGLIVYGLDAAGKVIQTGTVPND